MGTTARVNGEGFGSAMRIAHIIPYAKIATAGLKSTNTKYYHFYLEIKHYLTLTNPSITEKLRYMNKEIPIIKEGVEELKHMLKREHDSRKKQRLQALYLLQGQQGSSRREVAFLLGVHRDTVGR